MNKVKLMRKIRSINKTMEHKQFLAVFLTHTQLMICCFPNDLISVKLDPLPSTIAWTPEDEKRQEQESIYARSNPGP